MMVVIRQWMFFGVALLASVRLGAADVDSQLIEAARNGDTTAVRTLLQRGVDVNARGADSMTALQWAVHRDDLETVNLLVRAGANVNVQTRLGVSPLADAALNGNARVIEALLNAGADVNLASPEGETALMQAARNGRVEVLKALLAGGADVNLSESWKGQSALMWAAAEGHAAAVKTLLEVGANSRARSRTGFTAFLFAVRNGHLDTVKQLLAAGADPNDKVASLADSEAPRSPTQLRQDMSARVPISALGMAVINAYYELAAMLIDAGADPNVPDRRGSVLHAVAIMRSPGVGPQGGAPPPPTGSLHSLSLAEMLLKHGANSNARIVWKEKEMGRDAGSVNIAPDIPQGRAFLTYIGATPFYIAAKGGDVELMRLLIQQGANPAIPTVQGVTPLMAAAGLGYWDGESPGPTAGNVPVSAHVEAVKMLIDLGQDVNAVANFGGPNLEGDGGTLLRRHPLNLAQYDAPNDAALDVIPPVVSLGDMRWNGSTALHGAAARGVPALIQLLVDHGAKMDAKTTLGWTPLMIAEGHFVSNTEKDWPEAVDLIRKLMADLGLNPDLYNQKSLGLTTSRDVSRK